ncbi:MAG: VWA domain-containing protein, partial [Acidobacteria bacterium]|nr:VWA domain-containing protein [Acidobacteriota bacterium]
MRTNLLVAVLILNLASPAPAQEPVIRVTTRLVQVSAVVHDRRGKPVRDLKLGDFEVTDNGRKQTLGLFRLEQASGGETETELPPGEVSNRVAVNDGSPGSYSVVLFDSLNTGLADQAYARGEVLRFLGSVEPRDRVAICRMDGARLIIVHDFTNRADRLIAAFRRLMPEYDAKLAGSRLDPTLLKQAGRTASDSEDSAPGAEVSDVTDLQSQALLDAAFSESAFYTKDRVINSCTVLKALAARLAGFPGRKSIVWVSGGFPISSVFGEADAGNFIRNRLGAKYSELHASRIEEASRLLNDSNVAVYPVDVVGLRVSAMNNRNIASMTYLAQLTGGVAYYNTNGIEQSIRKALDDSSATYTLGYYLNNSDADRTYHGIGVKVNRPGVEVRSKRGYFSRPLAALDAGGAEQLSRDALWNPFDATSIGMRG